MYAIIEDSGSQMKVQEGETLLVDLRDLGENAKNITFDRVLMVGEVGGDARIGQPYVDGASVTAEIVDADVRDEKIDVIKFKRRKGYRRKQGHRQHHMKVKISSISG